MRKYNYSERIRSWFDSCYAAEGVASMREIAAYEQFVELLRRDGAKNLLDVGCGPGLLLKAACAAGLSCTGVDFSSEAVRLARRLVPSARVEVGRATGLPFEDGSFDAVTCIGVLEHIFDPDQALREMIRVATPDALLCVMVPNSKTVFWRMATLLKREFEESGESAASLPEWQEMFRSAGLRTDEIQRDGWRLKRALAAVGVRDQNLVSKVHRLVARVIPIERAHQFVFLMRPPTSPDRG